jgi:hypothetical protein
MIKTTRRRFAAALAAAPLLLRRGKSAFAQLSEMPPMPSSEAEQIALDAYVYGYSLITTEVTRVQMSNVDKIVGMHAPTGQFANIKRYPPADFRGCRRPTPIRSIRWRGSTSPSHRCSATPTWASASTCWR